MQDSSTTINSIPTNGSASINASSNGKGKKPTPSEQYKQIYGRSMTHEEVLRLRVGTVSYEIPHAVVGLLKRRMGGAQKRVARLKVELADVRKIVRSRAVVEKDQTTYIDETTCAMYRVKKLRTEAALIQAKEEFIMYRQQYQEVLGNDSNAVQKAIAAVRELAYINRTAPSQARKAVALIQQSGSIDKLKGLANMGTREEFRTAFVEAIKAGSDELDKALTARPKLLTRVVGLVVDQLRVPATQLIVKE